ncbi:MAG: 50S ribosome-binding GTPase [Methanomicrobia archaeon]|nr:50S ribosome-binding GTPase [Methanomicrobia archaeon]
MFKNIPIITKDMIIEKAFKRASKINFPKKKLPLPIKIRDKEMKRVEVASQVINSMLEKVVKRYPTFEHLDPFYREIIDITVSLDELKHNIGALSWGMKTIQRIKNETIRKMKRTRDINRLGNLRKEAYGRYISVLKRIEDNMEFLNSAREKLKQLPEVKSCYTIVIAGAPNVGKSTVLHILTGAEPEVRSYPFTTKGINIGYFEYKYNEVQVIDTPGLLDRRFEERNEMELKAISSLTHLANLIVFIVDPSESCGYPLEEQFNLLEDVKGMEIPLIHCQNKSDLKYIPDIAIRISAINEEIDPLKREIFKRLDAELDQ